VETLWILGHEKKIGARLRQNCMPHKRRTGFSRAPSLAAIVTTVRQSARSVPGKARAAPKTVNVHRYEEHIAGRTYLIEVRPITESRWRAQIARLPGMPTALMPFYGPTPEDAARELSRWLSLVYNGYTEQ
jgi:hypothetical protein